ncbi:MAG TPA: thioredoxin-like domain-containing protein [Chitinophagaceae bacterium]
MRAFLLLAVVFFLSSQVQSQQSATRSTARFAGGYHIDVKVTPLKNSWVYLYNYYGKYYQIADSARLNERSEGLFSGPKKLHGGIYLLVTDKKVRLCEVHIDKDQEFSIVADTSKPEQPVITGSPENTLYKEYSDFLGRVAPRLTELQQQFATAGTKEDSASIQKQISAGNKQLQDYRENIIRTQPESMLAAFFRTMKRPEVPEMPKKADGSLDSSYPFRYVQEHFWDDVDFADDRLVRTPAPIFESKLDDYFKYYVSPDADSIIKEVRYMLLYAREAKEMYRYLLARFTNKYMNPEIMGQDKVFVYLFENHYLKGDTSILTDKDKETVFKRGWSLIANQIGEPAPALDLVDSAGRSTPLYKLNAAYTLVVFWDPNCGHCKETVPRIDSIYRAKWKGLGMKVYAVNVDETTMKAWSEFIAKHDLYAWTHTYQPKAQRDEEAASGRPNFRQLYDVYKTPTLYLLDEQKRIIAKNLDISGFDEVLTAKEKNKPKK